MPLEQLDELDYFHSSVKDLFKLTLQRDFPIEKYFGDINSANQLMRDMQLHLEQGIDEFIRSCKGILEVFFFHRRRVLDSGKDSGEGVYPDDDELTSLLNNLKQQDTGKSQWKNGKQAFLLERMQRIMQKYLKDASMGENVPLRDEVFICYAHANKEWKDRIRTHLQPHERYFNITVWSDEKILPGEDWEDEIKGALRRAKVAILLLTPEFLSSNYIHDEELPDIMLASTTDELVILWFPVSPSAVLGAPLGRYKAAWDPQRTLSEMIDDDRPGEADRTLTDACKCVKSIMTAEAEG